MVQATKSIQLIKCTTTDKQYHLSRQDSNDEILTTTFSGSVTRNPTQQTKSIQLIKMYNNG